MKISSKHICIQKPQGYNSRIMLPRKVEPEYFGRAYNAQQQQILDPLFPIPNVRQLEFLENMEMELIPNGSIEISQRWAAKDFGPHNFNLELHQRKQDGPRLPDYYKDHVKKSEHVKFSLTRFQISAQHESRWKCSSSYSSDSNRCKSKKLSWFEGSV